MEEHSTNWTSAKGLIDLDWVNDPTVQDSGNPFMVSAGKKIHPNFGGGYNAWAANVHNEANITSLNTNLMKTVCLYTKGSVPLDSIFSLTTNKVFNSFGYSITTNWSILTFAICGYSNSVSFIMGMSDYPQPGWCAEPTYLGADNSAFSQTEGWEIIDRRVTIDWQFNYCTNKYW